MHVKFFIRKFLILISIIIIVTIPAYSATYYVKNGGDDSLDGLSDATAWATIDKVQSSVKSGDIIYFRSQDTWTGINPLLYAGVEGVTYDGSGYGTGTRATFKATSRSGSNGIVQIPESNIRFQGFRVHGNGLSVGGIAIGYTSPPPTGAISNITVHNCEVTNGITVDNPDPSWYYGIHVSMSGYSGQPASDIVVTNNWVHHTGHEGIAVYPQTSTASKVENVLIRNNTIHDTGMVGVRSIPLDIANDADNVILEYNFVYNCSSGINIGSYGPVCYGAPSPNGAIVRYNTLYDSYGISIRDYFCHEGIDGDGEIYGNIVKYGKLSLQTGNWNYGSWKIYNNVFMANYSAGKGDYALDGGLYRTSMNAENVEIRNNIFIGTGLRLVRDQANALSNIEHSNNLFYRTDNSNDIVQTSILSNANAVLPTEITVTHDASYTYFTKTGGTDWTTVFSVGNHVKWSGFGNEIFNDRLFVINGLTSNQIKTYNVYLGASGPTETAVVTGEKWVLTTLSASALSTWESFVQYDNPLFVDIANMDFHIEADSAAVNNGIDLGTRYKYDFDGVTRPQGLGWDIGAYEYLPESTVYECNDGIDNDGDGNKDYPNDLGCSSFIDDDETNCGDGRCEGGEDSSICSEDCSAKYYVKNGGDDSLDGLSDATAWAHCPGMSDWTGSATLYSGDIIYFRSQDTWESSTDLSTILTTTRGVAYDGSSYGNGIRATFKAMGPQNYKRGMVQAFESNVNFKGFEIDGNQQRTDGIAIGYSAKSPISNIVIDNVVVHDNGDPNNDDWLYGILVSSSLGTGTVVSNVNITNCLLYNNGHEAIALYESRLYTNNRATDILVKNCTIHDTGATSEGNGVGVLIANDIDNAIVEDCNIYNAGTGLYIRTSPIYEISEGNGAPDNMTIRNNYIHDNANSGISIVNPQGSNENNPVGMSGNFYNNIVANSGADCVNNPANYYKDAWELSIGQYHWENTVFNFYNNVFYNSVNTCTNSRGVVGIERWSSTSGFGGNPIFNFSNNIIYLNTNSSEWDFVPFWDDDDRSIHSNNLIYRSSSASDNVVYSSAGPYNGSTLFKWESTSISENPLFVDPLNEDFYLQADSQAIDTGLGLSEYFTTDFDGVIRPQGLGWDIGAYEYVEGKESSYYHEADLDKSGIIELNEVYAYIQLWLAGYRTIDEVLEVINLWFSER